MAQRLTRKEKIERMKAHAKARYNKGWDVIVECYDDEQLGSILEGVNGNLREAIKDLGAIVEIYNDRRSDAVNSAF